MDEYARSVIDSEYEKIIERMKLGKLFGYPIDFDDCKMLIVAAYHMAQSDEVQRNNRMNDLLLSLHK